MGDRVTFSGLQLELPDIAVHHQDLGSSLTVYFHFDTPGYRVRFIGYTPSEIADELGERLDEVDLTSSLAVLASIEAVFRIDYLQRCYRKEKDQLSRAFRSIYKTRKQQALLDEDIFEAWMDNSSVPRSIIGELRGAFRFRHWLAHGRYWTPKLGRRYDFTDVFALAELAVNSFPFYRAQ
ncbi:MAG: hypothetical protein ACREQ5_04850 [Candidatus Dormibacteria bacterium]